MVAVSDTASNVDAAVDSLRAVGQRTWQLDDEQRHKAMEILLAWHMRRMTVEGGAIFLQRVLRHIGTPAPARHSGAQKTVDTTALSLSRPALQTTLLRLGGEVDSNRPVDALVAEIEQRVEALHQRLRQALGKKTSTRSIEELLDQLDVRLAGSEESMKAAAKESFDRLLGSLNPANAETYIEGKVKIGPFYKGALFDALTEKYEQLKVYNDKGFLLRDFIGAYRARSKAEKESNV